jgi:hypothetical protein
MVLVGKFSDLQKYFERRPIEDDDRSWNGQLNEMENIFSLPNQSRPDCPLLARVAVAGLAIDADGNAKGYFSVINEYLGFGGWTETCLGTSYQGQGFSEKLARGLAAGLIGFGRPDQIVSQFLGGLTEASLRRLRSQIEGDITISPAPWDKEIAAEAIKKFVKKSKV